MPGPCWINGALTSAAIALLPLLLFSSPVLTRILLREDDQPYLSEKATRDRLRKAKSGAQATTRASREPAGDPGSPGPRPPWPSPQSHWSQLGSHRELLHQGLSRAPASPLSIRGIGGQDRESGWPKATQPKKDHLWRELVTPLNLQGRVPS